MKTTNRDIQHKKRNLREAGNAIVMLFAAVGMAGVVGYGLNNVMRGPAMTAAELSKRTIAENNLVASSRMAISAAAQQADSGDCDRDGFVEPLQYRDAGANPKPVGGGYLPLSMGVSISDPWNTQYGYCVWDQGTLTVTDNVTACGGSSARRLVGSKRDDQPAIAIISAGKDGIFQKKCRAFVDTTPADGSPDLPMVYEDAPNDDIVLTYTYAEANGIGGGLWKLKSVADPNDKTTAEISKNLEVGDNSVGGQRGATFGGALTLTQKGLILPGDPGDNSVTGACNAAKDQQLRRNTSTNPPSLELCDFAGGGGWVVASGGSGAAPSCTFEYWRARAHSADWTSIAMSGDGRVMVAAVNNGYIFVSTDRGKTWAQRSVSRNYNKGAAVSLDGTKMMQVATGWPIYLSTDSGATWTTSGGALNPHQGAAASSDFTRLGFVLNGGGVYTSSDSGASFGVQAGAGTRAWNNLASSASGQKLVSGVLGGQIYTSNDYGVTWVGVGANRNWIEVASSANGQKMIASVLGSKSYLSNDGGATWNIISALPTNTAGGVGMSADGQTILSASGTGAGQNSYVSVDGGTTWTLLTNLPVISTGYIQAAVSADGKTMAAVPSVSGNIYTSYCEDDGTLAAPSEYRVSAPHPLDVGLVSRWKMDEGTGTVVNDSIGTNHGAFVNTPQWITGTTGAGGVGFQKADRDAVQITGLLGSTLNGTVAGWVNINSLDTVGTSIFTIGQVLTVANQADMGLFLAYVDAGSTNYFASSNVDIQGTGWRYVTATFDSTNNYFRIYLDGILLKETVSAPDLSYASASANTLIGRDTTTDRDHDGGIDDVRFYNRALAPSEVKELYDRAKAESNVPDLSPIAATTDFYKGKISLPFNNDYFGCGIKPDSSLWCWGNNNYLALGTAKYASSTIPVAVTNPSTPNEWIMVAAGGAEPIHTDFACGIKSDNTGWCWGADANAQLGNGATLTASQPIPSPIAGGFLWSKLSAGNVHACGITTEGRLYCWGDDNNGKLGNAGNGNAAAPDAVGADRWADISAGASHTCGIKADGSAWCWGSDSNGQLGNGTGVTADQLSPYAMGSDKWARISAAATYTCGIKADGSAWCWGADTSGRLGNGDTITADQPEPYPVAGGSGKWVDISTGRETACGIKADGSAWCWGSDSDGQLGNGATLTADQSLPSRVLLPNPVSAITVGLTQACAMESNGAVWCWGDDTRGALGNGAVITGDQSSPTRVANWPNPAPFLWNDAVNSISMNPGTTMALADKWISDDGTSKYFGFQGRGKAALSQPTGGSQLLVETGTAGQAAQLSFRAPAATLTGAVPAPVARWLLDDTAGTTVTSAPVTFNGTASGSAVWNTTGGYVSTSGALEFNANGNGRVTVARHATLEPTNVTVAFWMKMEGPQAPGATILSKTHSNNTGTIKNAYAFQIEPGNKISFVTGRTGGSDKLVSNTTIRPNSWIHVVGTYTPAGNLKALYINGKLDNQIAQNSAIAYDTTATGALHFGAACATAPCQQFHGALDEIRINNTAISADLIRKMYNDYIATMASPQTVGIDQATNNFEIGRNNAASTNFLDAITPDLAILPAGNVGIGAATAVSKLDVAGGVRPGMQEACATANAGTIRYTKGSYCEDTTATWNAKLTNDVWEGIAMTRDGSTILVGANVGFAQISRDGGDTFSQVTSLGSGQWAAMAMSADGKNMLAGSNNGGGIYRSTDGGISWSQTAAPAGNWLRMAISDDGTKVAAAEWTGFIYISSDSGQTWTQRASNLVWAAITMSGDGTKLAAANKNGKIWTSTTGGTSWTSQAGSPTQAWYAMAGSGDGKTLIAGASGGGDLVWKSTDFGVTWAPLATGSADILGLAMSSDGNTMAAAGFGYIMRISKNGGTTWANSAVARDWRAVTISRDGRKIVGSEHNALIHISNMCADTASQPAYQSCDGTAWVKWPPAAAAGFVTSRKYGGLSAGGSTSCSIKNDGTAWCWGGSGGWSGYMGQRGDGLAGGTQLTPSIVSNAGPWQSLDVGGYHGCGIKMDGTAWCWGSGGSGERGDNTLTVTALNPVQVVSAGTWKQISAGENFTCGIKNDGTAWCWGDRTDGHMGNGTSSGTQQTPTQVSGTGTWKQISAGTFHACGIKNDGTAWCWGSGFSGQIGNGSNGNQTTPVTVTGTGTWREISAGAFHTCGIKNDGTAWCWGGGGDIYVPYYGQRGDGINTVTINTPSPVSGAGTWVYITAGWNHACGIKNDGTAWCWGGGGFGQLGDSTATPAQLTPVQVSGGGTWSYIAPGAFHTCGTKIDGSTLCWGGNNPLFGAYFGQRGDGTTTDNVNTPVAVVP